MGKAAELKEQYVQMNYLRQLFLKLQSEIRYARTPLGEIFFHIGQSAKEPYQTWFLKMSRRMERRDGDVLSHMWRQEIRENLADAGLPEEELARLEEFGSQLGSADMEMQVKAIELYQTQLSLAMSELKEELGAKVKLYQCLGVMGGMLITIMLL